MFLASRLSRWKGSRNGEDCRLSWSTGPDLSEDLLEVVPIANWFEVGLGLEVDAIAEALANGGSNASTALTRAVWICSAFSGRSGPGDLGVARGKKNRCSRSTFGPTEKRSASSSTRPSGPRGPARA